MIRVGGLAARQADEDLSRRFGVPGDEGLGPGGAANALRTLPVLAELAADLRRVAPGATVLNLVSPLGPHHSGAARCVGSTSSACASFPRSPRPPSCRRSSRRPAPARRSSSPTPGSTTSAGSGPGPTALRPPSTPWPPPSMQGWSTRPCSLPSGRYRSSTTTGCSTRPRPIVSASPATPVAPPGSSICGTRPWPSSPPHRERRRPRWPPARRPGSPTGWCPCWPPSCRRSRGGASPTCATAISSRELGPDLVIETRSTLDGGRLRPEPLRDPMPAAVRAFLDRVARAEDLIYRSWVGDDEDLLVEAFVDGPHQFDPSAARRARRHPAPRRREPRGSSRMNTIRFRTEPDTATDYVVGPGARNDDRMQRRARRPTAGGRRRRAGRDPAPVAGRRHRRRPRLPRDARDAGWRARQDLRPARVGARVPASARRCPSTASSWRSGAERSAMSSAWRPC